MFINAWLSGYPRGYVLGVVRKVKRPRIETVLATFFLFFGTPLPIAVNVTYAVTGQRVLKWLRPSTEHLSISGTSTCIRSLEQVGKEIQDVLTPLRALFFYISTLDSGVCLLVRFKQAMKLEVSYQIVK